MSAGAAALADELALADDADALADALEADADALDELPELEPPPVQPASAKQSAIAHAATSATFPCLMSNPPVTWPNNNCVRHRPMPHTQLLVRTTQG